MGDEFDNFDNDYIDNFEDYGFNPEPFFGVGPIGTKPPSNKKKSGGRSFLDNFLFGTPNNGNVFGDEDYYDDDFGWV